MQMKLDIKVIFRKMCISIIDMPNALAEKKQTDQMPHELIIEPS